MNKPITRKMLSPKEAEKVQNEIYRKMPAIKKIKIAGQLFLLGKKLDELKNPLFPHSTQQKIYDTGKTALQNCKDFTKT